MKNYLKAAVLAVTAFITLTACADSGAGGAVNNTDGVTPESSENVRETIADEIVPREETPDSLPGGLNFNNGEIRILHRDSTGGFLDWQYEIAVDEEIGEIVNDAVYHRNRAVEERLNVNIMSISIPGDWGNMNGFLRTVRNSVGAGSDDYDLIAGYAYYIPVLAPEGLLYNLKSVPYLNPEAEWWSADCAEQMTIDGKLYYITGDLALSLLRSMNVIFFNKLVAQDLSIENLYQTVLSGDFTLDKMTELIKDIYRDLNGDGGRDKDDMYGYATGTGNKMNTFNAVFDQPIVRKDGAGIPQFVINTPKMIDIVNKMHDFLYENENVHAASEALESEAMTMFQENRTLFMAGYLYESDNLRAMESDYGILPMPKWNKEQPAHYTVSADVYSLFCIPVTCSRLEAVGAVMEALCAESYRTVTPAYYEIALKLKYSRDDETSQMLDLIRAGIRFDFGTVNAINLNDAGSLFRRLMESRSTDFASRYEASENIYQSALDNLAEAYQNLP
ncbi:MAG: hypothetical protein FWH24_02940 [Oscillospiraceae bacterium]|nr:hypothetical protein [Oscillospiraceae bacterium]